MQAEFGQHGNLNWWIASLYFDVLCEYSHKIWTTMLLTSIVPTEQAKRSRCVSKVSEILLDEDL